MPLRVDEDGSRSDEVELDFLEGKSVGVGTEPFALAVSVVLVMATVDAAGEVVTGVVVTLIASGS